MNHSSRYTLFLQAFNGVLNGLKLYPPQHPACLKLYQSLWDILQDVLVEERTMTLGLVDDTLFIGDHLYTDGNAAANHIAARLSHFNIEGIEFSIGLQQQHLNEFVDLFNTGKLQGNNFNDIIFQANIIHIRQAQRDNSASGGNDSGASACRKAYDGAISAVQGLTEEILNGQIPQSDKVITSVDNMIQQMIKTPYALLALNMIKDYDDYTYGHSVNVSVIALTIGRVCQLDSESLSILGIGSLLHDLGKLKIDPKIIKKAGQLSCAEYEQIKNHPELGAQIAREMDNIDPRAIDIILGHHLHFDRSGYPRNAITSMSSDTTLTDITTIADTYDAITTLRAYRRPSTPRRAIAIMKRLAGVQLNPKFVHLLEQTLGSFPVGSLVRLINNEIGLIVDMDALNLENSTIRIIKDDKGRNIDNPYDLQLTNSSLNIAGEVDPLSHDIDLKTLL
jgi:putative nucleotidyltransferase with HDIG domain